MLPIFETLDGQSRIYIEFEGMGTYFVKYYPDINDEYDFYSSIYEGERTDEEWLETVCLYENLDPKAFVKIGESDY